MARIDLSGRQIPTLSKLNIDGELTLDSASGTSGQVLTSAGAGNTPTWSALPSASASVSGIVTTGSQTFAGTKTFSSSIDTPGIARSAGVALGITLSTASATSNVGSISILGGSNTSNGSGGSITLTGGNYTASGAAGAISIDAGSGPTGGAISIGTTNASAFTIGRTGITIDAPGAMTVAQTLTGGNLTTGGTLTRTILAGGGASTASIDNNGRFIRTTSSARYKQDISDVAYDYQDVLSLEPKTFRLKDEVEENADSRTYAGFIAEDVHEIDSLRVFVNYLTQEDGSKIPDGIAYGEMVSALVSAIKHQDTLIKSLETRIEQLENQ